MNIVLDQIRLSNLVFVIRNFKIRMNSREFVRAQMLPSLLRIKSFLQTNFYVIGLPPELWICFIWPIINCINYQGDRLLSAVERYLSAAALSSLSLFLVFVFVRKQMILCLIADTEMLLSGKIVLSLSLTLTLSPIVNFTNNL